MSKFGTKVIIKVQNVQKQVRIEFTSSMRFVSGASLNDTQLLFFFCLSNQKYQSTFQIY